MENKTMMKLVIGTEAMFFLSLIMAFVYMAYNAGFEPHELHQLDIMSTGVFTVVLIGSSFTLLAAEKKYKQGNIQGLKLWMTFTIALGLIFLIGQAKEYVHLINRNITLGGSVFGTSFYTLTGFHGLHVFIGLVVLLIVLQLAFLGDFNKRSSSVIRVVAMYWHFVDIVWVFVFTIVYVLPHFSSI